MGLDMTNIPSTGGRVGRDDAIDRNNLVQRIGIAGAVLDEVEVALPSSVTYAGLLSPLASVDWDPENCAICALAEEQKRTPEKASSKPARPKVAPRRFGREPEPKKEVNKESTLRFMVLRLLQPD
jgi:hypothetical protein